MESRRLTARTCILSNTSRHQGREPSLMEGIMTVRPESSLVHSKEVKTLIKSIAFFLAAFAALTVSAASAPKITLSGKAQSCHPGTPIRLVGVRAVNISAFQVSKVPLLMSKLKTMDTTTIVDGASMMRLDTLSRAADSLANSSTALLRVVSDLLGNFKLSIPVTDSVVVYGLGHDEDDPINHAFKTMSGRANTSFVLDMSHGGCGP